MTAPSSPRYFLGACFFAAAVACEGTDPTKDDSDTSPEALPDLAGITFDANGEPGPLPEDFLVSYSQTLCFGWCPAFQVTIDRDGAGTYVGQGCVQDPGPVSTWVAPHDLRDIVATLGALRFAELDERYAALQSRFAGLTDSPSAIITVRSGGVETTVDDYLGNEALYAYPPASEPWNVPIGPLPEWFARLRHLHAYVYDVTGVARPIGNPHVVPECGI